MIRDEYYEQALYHIAEWGSMDVFMYFHPKSPTLADCLATLLRDHAVALRAERHRALAEVAALLTPEPTAYGKRLCDTCRYKRQVEAVRKLIASGINMRPDDAAQPGSDEFECIVCGGRMRDGFCSECGGYGSVKKSVARMGSKE